MCWVVALGHDLSPCQVKPYATLWQMHDAIALGLAMPTILRGIVANPRGLATSVLIHRSGVVVQVCGLAQDLEVLGCHRVVLVREVAPCCRQP